ncbi:MAG: NDP-hexose 2,3-dehydratase [Bacteroidetes bacterium]|nr:NDP-hexose 2,3-dehydratase [Bacteroidota bacterium]
MSDIVHDSYSFLKSAFAVEGSFLPTKDVIKWLQKQNEEVYVNIRKTNFDELSNWIIDCNNIRHESGKFFSIDGINIKTNWGTICEWEQPIINQPEIGYLGFISKEFNGVLHFLMQAKIEPGNVNYVQLSPTLQATRSNYSQVHNGKKPLYLEYFQNAKPNQILLDQLQSEQGARFLRKRNRNIIIKVDEDLPLHKNFIWLTLGQLKQLMLHNNLVNMDTRTVISGIPFGSFEPEVIDFYNYLYYKNNTNEISQALLKSTLINKGSLHSIENIITFLTQKKSIYDLDVNKIQINKLKNWIVRENEIVHVDNKFFKIIAVDVEIGNREVVNWSQPMVEPAQEGLCAFVCKEINGILHFAVQTKLECGNHDIIEFAPTVQCLTGNYKLTKRGDLPFLEYVLNANKDQIIFDTLQSEEGGRFYKEQNRNMIIIGKEDIPLELPDNYIWMTLNQLSTFLKFNNYLNIQARSLIAAISFV